jgi:hypothetical protein
MVGRACEKVGKAVGAVGTMRAVGTEVANDPAGTGGDVRRARAGDGAEVVAREDSGAQIPLQAVQVASSTLQEKEIEQDSRLRVL